MLLHVPPLPISTSTGAESAAFRGDLLRTLGMVGLDPPAAERLILALSGRQLASLEPSELVPILLQVRGLVRAHAVSVKAVDNAAEVGRVA